MKKLITFSLLFLSVLGAKAQDAKNVFSTNEIVYFGLDFSRATFVGQFDQGAGAMPATGSDMKNKWANSWNELVAKEQPKYDLKKTFRKDNVIYDLKSITEINKKIDPDKCMSYNEGKISPSDVTEMVKAINPDVKKDGVGVVFIVENFNKTTTTASVYVTFFDISTKKVLFSEKVNGKVTTGVGLRNYWAGGIKDILKQIDENEYKNWKSKHG